MKKFTIVIFLALAILKTQAQNYLINFAGAGATTEVGTVKVDNLTSGATVTLNGGDILHLKAPLGIEMKDMANGTLQIYPNPMAEQSMLTFVAPENGNAVICIVDISGKTVSQISTLFSTGTHSFRVSGISQGMYFVKVTGKNYNYSAKLISQSNLQSEARIEYVPFDKNTTGNPLKSTASIIDMPYTEGDQLLYKGISGIYSTIVTDIPISSKTTTFTFVACTDSDGNHYATVRIGIGKSGVQTWMAQNLNVGVLINDTLDPINNGIIEKWCYNDSVNNCNTYGGLYHWKEMMQYVTTEGAQGICPSGWHIPTDTEWTMLTDYLGGLDFAAFKMRETGTAHWPPPNEYANNSSGFTALGGGCKNLIGGFSFLTNYAYFWSSSFLDTDYDVWDREIGSNYEVVSRRVCNYQMGFSARCLQN